MENPGSSIIAALGGGSGVDFLRLADDLSDATYSFQRTTLQSRNETLQARISSASILRSTLTSLASATGDRIRNGELAPRAVLGNPSVASVSTVPGIVPRGSYSLEVTQLADSQTLVTPSYSAASDTVGAGTLTFRFGTVSGASFTEDTGNAALQISVTAEDTLSSLASKISTQSDGRLSAYVATGTNGAQLVIKGRDGAASGFVIDAQSADLLPLDQPGNLSYLAWSPASDAGELRSTAQDALFRFDSVQMSSASNNVTGLPEGISLTLTGTNQGAPTTLSFTNDESAITDVMTDFVAALNDLARLLNEEASALGGTLGNDSGARELKRDLSRLSSIVVMPSAGDGEPRTLADLGLKTTREGNFEFDSDRLAETLAANPEATAAMFTTGPFGVFATIDRLARQNTSRSDPGSLAGSVSRYEKQIERNDDRLATIAEQQENLRARLTKQLIAAERTISTSQSTLSFLQQQFAPRDNN